MKTALLAGALALTAFAVPFAAAAQDQPASSEIFVTAKHQKAWDKGNKLEAEGLAEMQKAKEELVKYSADLVNAQNLRNSSQERAANARAAFENLTQNPYFTEAEYALDWAKQVEKAASDWKKFSERTDEGAKDFKRSQSRQEKAQAAVDKAQAKIDKGRQLKHDAEEASRAGAHKKR